MRATYQLKGNPARLAVTDLNVKEDTRAYELVSDSTQLLHPRADGPRTERTLRFRHDCGVSGKKFQR